MKNIKLRKILIKISISSNIQGFHYILAAIDILKNENKYMKMTTLYEKISNKYRNTPSAIERSIRYAINRAYHKNNILKNIYTSIPDNSNFLFDLVWNFDVFE